MSEVPGAAGRIGRALLDQESLLFQWWHRVRDGTLGRSSFRVYVSPSRQRVWALLEEGTRCGHAKTEATCRELLEVEQAMWTFVRIDGVEPTNNNGERALRPAVIWRKISHGTHSRAGSQFVERMLTVATTLRQQKRNVVRFVVDAIGAAQTGQRPPSILPVDAIGGFAILPHQA